MTAGTQHNRLSLSFFSSFWPSVLFFLFFSFFFYDAGEGVTDGETECRDDEDVKCATFTHLLLYCLSLQERSEGVSGKQTGGYKDTGLPSLIHQPIGLDRIHQLPRIHRLPLSLLSLSPYLSLSTLASPPVLSLSVNFYSPFAVYLPPSPLLPSLPFPLSSCL